MTIQKRLASLTILSLMFFALAVSMPVQVMLLYGHESAEVWAILNKLTWLNAIVLGGLVFNGMLLWKVSPWLRYTIPALIAVVGANNYIVGYYATDFSNFTTSLATLGFAALNLPILDARVIWILRHPDRRWWRRAERKKMSIPLFIEGSRLNTIRAECFDISETGLFIPETNGLGVGDWVNIKISFDSLSQIRTRARVVRRAEARGIYPAGVGVEFIDISSHQKRAIKRGLDRSLQPAV
jgi:hypothetical protein